MVKAVVDLRPQLRTLTPVTATTKDGIEVKVDAFIAMRLACEEPQPRLDRSFPFDAESVRQAVHIQRVSQDGGESVRWDALVRQVCERVVRDIIAEYKLDELRGFEAHSQIASRVKDDIRKHLEINDWRIDLISGGIGNIEPAHDVIQGRIEYWKAHWESLITVLKAKAEAKERTMIENARARVHRDLFLKLTQGLMPIKDLDSNKAYELMVLNLLEAIEQEGTADPELTGPTASQMHMLQNRLATGRRSGPSGGTQ
jgi:regulator of protease activity HflC (stomatin/prohibitin superfamily)